MDKVFLDTDVLIDFLIDREPFATYAAEIMSLADKGSIQVSVSALSINNIHYIIRKYLSEKKTRDILGDLLAMIEILKVDKQDIQQALVSPFKDFEDAIQHSVATQEGELEVIITRNIKDYKKAAIQVFSPEQYLKLRSLS
ncbi:PIN domain-containing protein [Gracilimonas mengyeensis]|uniref:PIN domain-containing protein n=1 Tax=Gracilimonas mengyeensis TaxID=1302730 RepID=A0A521AGX8_9BACT|nr:PIN domain-containing protein [Gracilimonas mengyeensis]SMO34077.1 PIN domain-containing protein [Gracilimonas mengyeensis]